MSEDAALKAAVYLLNVLRISLAFFLQRKLNEVASYLKQTTNIDRRKHTHIHKHTNMH